MSLLSSKPKHDFKCATEHLIKICKPSDIININGYDGINPLVFVPHKCIRLHQKELFGPLSYYRDTHTTVYFSYEKIFSVTSPMARWESVEHIAKQRFTVYRYTKKEFTDKELLTMYTAALKIIGTKYDYGQLLDIALNHILGYKHIRKAKLFDLGARRLVCSVGARTLYEKVRYDTRNDKGEDTMDRLFNKLSPAYWSKQEIDNFTRSDIELTSPGHFANSERYDEEFREILNWRAF